MLVLFLALPLLAAAAEAAPVCPATPAPLPAVLAGWTMRTAITPSPAAAAPSMLPIGKRADVSLSDSAAVPYIVAPAKPAAPGSMGAVLGFTVAHPGTYRVALGTGAWIDVLSGGKPVAAVAHDHGPACSGIRKTVDFKLAPGGYILQISDATVAVAGILVAPLP